MHRTIHPGLPEGEDASGVVDAVGMAQRQHNRNQADRASLVKAVQTHQSHRLRIHRVPMEAVPADIRKVRSAPAAVLVDLVRRVRCVQLA
jgi:hypothetical protein